MSQSAEGAGEGRSSSPVSQRIMMAAGNERPARIWRGFFRMPRILYDVGLGGTERWLGLEWVEITTRGRKTGRPHRILLDLIGEDAARGRFFAQSAYGRRSDWVKNLEHDARCEVRVGRRQHSARAVAVSADEAKRILVDYVRRHRFYSPLIARLMGYRGASAPEHVAPWLLERFGMIAFEIDGG